MSDTARTTSERRPNRAALWGIGFTGVFLAGALAAAMHASARPAQDTKLEDAFWKVCRDCHEPDRIREIRRTRGGWEEIIEKMIEKGAVGSEQDFENVLQYLLANYGMVNMNQATAEDIALVIGLSKKDAGLIVAYRTEHGKFKSYDELAQVPGLDVKLLEEHRASMMF